MILDRVVKNGSYEDLIIVKYKMKILVLIFKQL